MALSDRIALLRGGALEQVASAREIYEYPATAYTAQFIGHTNLLRGEVRDGMFVCGALSWPARGENGAAIFSLRPEAICLASADATSQGSVRFSGARRKLAIFRSKRRRLRSVTARRSASERARLRSRATLIRSTSARHLQSGLT